MFTEVTGVEISFDAICRMDDLAPAPAEDLRVRLTTQDVLGGKVGVLPQVPELREMSWASGPLRFNDETRKAAVPLLLMVRYCGW